MIVYHVLHGLMRRANYREVKGGRGVLEWGGCSILPKSRKTVAIVIQKCKIYMSLSKYVYENYENANYNKPFSAQLLL